MSESNRVSRRQFSRLVASSAAGVLLSAGAEAEPPVPVSQPHAEDPRIGQLERERSAPLSEAQRTGLPKQLKDLDDGSAPLRKFPLEDGGSEPGILFRPTRRNPTAPRRKEGRP